VESTFGTAKRVYRANDIRAKPANTASVWTALCYLAKNEKKILFIYTIAGYGNVILFPVFETNGLAYIC